MAKISESGRKNITTFCDYIPHEILYAGGFNPIRLIGNGKQTVGSRRYFPTYMCSFAMDCSDVLFDNVDLYVGYVFANSCHAMEALYEIARENIRQKPVMMLNVPRTEDQDAIVFFAKELAEFIKTIEEKFNIPITKDSLSNAIRIYNEKRSLAYKIEKLITQDQLFLSADETLQLNEYSIKRPSKFVEFGNKLINIHNNDLKHDANKQSPRIIISGSIYSPRDLVSQVESCGGRVVVCDNCSSFRSIIGNVDETEEPLLAISKRYLEKRSCARQTNIKKRIDELFDLIRNYNVDGVIFSTIKFCPDQSYSVITMVEELNQRGIPNLVIDDAYACSSSAQIQTRVQAFLERLL